MPPHILLVDDDELNRFVGQELLQGIGVKVSLAESGQDAISQLQTEVFDLIFMDVSMPELDGYETTRRIRANRQFTDLPIVALTAHAFASERGRCLAAGMSDHLGKPFTLDDLRLMIQKWSPGNGLHQELPAR